MKRLYFDYAASTPCDPKVSAAMWPYVTQKFGNPGSLHSFGQEAMAAVDGAREKIANSVGAKFRDIIFTSSATEANNLAIRGATEGARFKARDKPKIIISAVEHESVLETARAMEKEGTCKLVVIPVDREGVVDVKKLKAALDKHTVLVSVMYVNNEVGSVQPIVEISKIIKEFKENTAKDRSPKPYTLNPIPYPLFHTDAAQAFCYFDCSVEKLGVDLTTLSSQKIYGPKGCGALYIRQGIGWREQGLESSNRKSTLNPPPYPLFPILHGGGQEFGMRSGTENVPAIVGFGKAVELAEKNRMRDAKKIADLKNYFWSGIKKIYPEAEVNGVAGRAKGKTHFAPHILNIYFPGYAAQDFLTRLDLAGIAVSAGSACSARSPQLSHVLKAIGLSEKRARESVRFSFGRPTTRGEINTLLSALKKILKTD